MGVRCDVGQECCFLSTELSGDLGNVQLDSQARRGLCGNNVFGAYSRWIRLMLYIVLIDRVYPSLSWTCIINVMI